MSLEYDLQQDAPTLEDQHDLPDPIEQTADDSQIQEIDPLDAIVKTISIGNSPQEIEDRRKQIANAEFVAGRLALTGQITVFFAGPNTGKTLLSLKLVSEARAAGMTGKTVFHINLDDTFEGITTKAELGAYHGFNEVAPETFSSPLENLNELIDKLVEDNCVSNTIIILDTIKKFVDVMNKGDSSKFMTTCRRFTSSGGTIIALAHTNKKTSESDPSIPAGTSDVLDDCDCAYTIGELVEEKVGNGSKRTVTFTNKKARGPVVKSAVYQYTSFEDGDYTRMFNSVKLLNGSDADKAREAQALAKDLQNDSLLIAEITDSLNQAEPQLQKDLVANVHANGNFSKAKIHTCLSRWSTVVVK